MRVGIDYAAICQLILLTERVSDELDVGGAVPELTFLSAIKLNERVSLRPRGKELR
jgi:hypothetical protein